MDIAWAAFGICIIVGFVFYILAKYWQRLLVSHSWSIQRLSERVQALEAMEDPDFRRRLSDSTPSPLEQVYTFTFRLSERFWKDTLQATPEELAYVKSHGQFLGSIKIERWRGHSVVTIFELLPQSRSAGWQSRSIDLYPLGDGYVRGDVYPSELPDENSSATLWELPLSAASEAALGEPPGSLELRLEASALVLCARHRRFGAGHANGSGSAPDGLGEKVFFIVPFDEAKIAAYRTDDGLEASADSDALARHAAPWLAFYAHQDEGQGVDWQLCVRDLVKKAEWERWKIFEHWEPRRVKEVE